jgi:hypothetical protein
LHYADGARQAEPLVVGRNVDCMSIPFATQVAVYQLDWLTHVSAFALAADESRSVNSIEVRLFAADASFGILALNLVLPDFSVANQH